MGDGATEAEAIADVRAAALCWVDGLIENGRDIPHPQDHEDSELVALQLVAEAAE